MAVLQENHEAVEKLLYMMSVASVNVDHLNNDRQVKPRDVIAVTDNR